MIGFSAASLILVSLAGSGDMSELDSNIPMRYSMKSMGVYGAAPPLELLVTESGAACAINLTHDLRKDMSMKVFTGIGGKCLPLSGGMSMRFARLAELVTIGGSQEPSRGDSYLDYSLGRGSSAISGSLVLSEESQVVSNALSEFLSLHLHVSSEGSEGFGISPELKLVGGRTVELIIRNIGERSVSIGSPKYWEDSFDPLVPAVTASVWDGVSSAIVVLGPENWHSFESGEAISIGAGNAVSMRFNVSKEDVEKIEAMSATVQIAGRLRFNVMFEGGPSGMATGAINAANVEVVD